MHAFACKYKQKQANASKSKELGAKRYVYNGLAQGASETNIFIGTNKNTIFT